MSKIRWERQTQTYTNGFNGYLGKALIFQTNWDSSGSRCDNNKTVLGCKLAGYKSQLGNYCGEDTAQAHAEVVLTNWLEYVGLQFKEEDICQQHGKVT